MMADLRYDFLDDNFTRFTNVETPKVELNLPLSDKPIDISDWAQGISSSGTPIVKPNSSKLVINNTEEQELNNYSYTPSKNMKGDKKKAYEFFISKGLQPHHAAGIVGNLMHESGLNTTIKGDGGKAFGLAQWHPDRQKGLETLAKSLGTDKSDFNTQLEYVWQELNTTEKKALDALLNSKSTEQATSIFCQYYERPGKPQLQKRINYAKSLLS